MFKLWKTTVFGIVFVGIALVWIFFVGFNSSAPGSYFNKGNNALWLGHEWVGDEKSDIEIQNLISKLQKHQIKTVFVHVGPLKSDGSIDPETYEHAVNFVEKAKLYGPDISYQAWMGQIRSKIDLAEAHVRHNVAKQSFIMTWMVGFDGVHFDIEPVWDKDENFILMLKESRELIGDDYLISVALAEFIPRSFVWLTQKIHKFENYNTEVNYKNVAKYSDQIVVMVYDTGFDKVWKYEWLVKEQAIWVTRLFKDKQVFIGIPCYEEVKKGFDPLVENVESGLNGLIRGLNNTRSRESSFEGVAIYPHWEMSESEWETFDRLWIGK